MRAVNSASQARLQADNMVIIELIDLVARNASFHWTTANGPTFATWAGSLTLYTPFPGTTPSGIQESSDLGVAVIDFVIANSGDTFTQLLAGGDFALSSLSIDRVFADTPDLGRMSVYVGRIGDYAYNRNQVTGQARNLWQSLSIQWPYFNYQDACNWRFGSPGCGFNTSSITQTINSLNVNSCTQLVLQLNSGTLSNSFVDGRFNFGRCTVIGGVNSGMVRTIRIQSGDTLWLSYPLPVNSFAGMTLSVYPGCRKTLSDCTSLYNNSKNFLGWPEIPIQEQAVV